MFTFWARCCGFYTSPKLLTVWIMTWCKCDMRSCGWCKCCECFDGITDPVTRFTAILWCYSYDIVTENPSQCIAALRYYSTHNPSQHHLCFTDRLLNCKARRGLWFICTFCMLTRLSIVLSLCAALFCLQHDEDTPYKHCDSITRAQPSLCIMGLLFVCLFVCGTTWWIHSLLDIQKYYTDNEREVWEVAWWKSENHFI